MNFLKIFLEKFCVKAKNKSIDTHKKVDTGEKNYFFDIFFLESDKVK